MNSLGLILLLSTLSSLSAAFAQNCPPKFAPLVPHNSVFNKACSANSASKSPCFHHVSGPLHSASVFPKSSDKDPTPDVYTSFIVKDGFLTDFTITDITIPFYVAHLETGLGLLYMPSDRTYAPISSASCYAAHPSPQPAPPLVSGMEK
ncbi:hypothetical protein NDA11_002129 [Ustilago hordei]|uniref:Mig1 protein n=1 Tax=Ustilago hordei TaxID=120017 RepID=I2FZB7_USTHO|nr:hypothetical protein NDA10_006247 [Ustilago hordei]KAJ1577001.1 hypothetical protein NDA15_005001 [Ustilago hordei]KAJ1578669.1 hypothetical protein NDA12_004234 [Ustilago hordei]KAJ1584002.1 hypothetical protein NDA11_002129 [Ustilago hordei]KAJ1599328.1 hypothetical protein NDA14_006857 [Ustilago hordei]